MDEDVEVILLVVNFLFSYFPIFLLCFFFLPSARYEYFKIPTSSGFYGEWPDQRDVVIIDGSTSCDSELFPLPRTKEVRLRSIPSVTAKYIPVNTITE